MKQKHLFHLVDQSPWPLIASIGALVLTLGGTISMNNRSYASGFQILITGFLIVLFTMFVWWRDVVREGTFQEKHTGPVQKGLRLGMLLFIVSEVMFFFAFFWAFFHSSLAPAIQIGSVWPPVGIHEFHPLGAPGINTLILLLSGCTITWAHFAILIAEKEQARTGFLATIFLGILFTFLQALEYFEAPFSINDGIYGSTFYLATGFHGIHVIIGTIFIIVCFIRFSLGHFTVAHHFGFEAAAWYWHFVDVVWLFLFVSIYWWGSSYF